MQASEGIFPTFFLSGFECSTFDWKGVGRRNLVAETRHLEHAQEDYAFLRHLGIGVAREGAPWPFIDLGGGRYDFRCIDPLIEAMHAQHVLPVWDLCHLRLSGRTGSLRTGFCPAVCGLRPCGGGPRCPAPASSALLHADQ